MKLIAKESDRLDQIVYNHYGTLEVFEQVLKFNPNLEPSLKAGDVIFLPEIKIENVAKKDNSLW